MTTSGAARDDNCLATANCPIPNTGRPPDARPLFNVAAVPRPYGACASRTEASSSVNASCT